uniref:Uncharacterized protein n=1 Tax=Anopheles quadriannulatus TaxID=34691 RepID=A0A182XSH3_ANOQN
MILQSKNRSMSGYSSKMSNCSSTWSIRAMIFLNFGCAQLSASLAGGSSPGCGFMMVPFRITPTISPRELTAL